MKRLHGLLLVCVLLCAYIVPSYAQSDTSSRKVIDMKAYDFMRNLNYEGQVGQRLIGNVVLFHNDTHMYCDSAYFFGSRFKAFGHVMMENKDGARLYGDSLDYDGNLDLAKVRGGIVRLVDSTAELRTSFLDFNTKDNIGYFFDGGTVLNKENLLESRRGYYYSKQKLFIFRDELEMKDTVYTVRSDSAHYNSASDIATFYGNTSIWHKDGFLSCLYGWFDRRNDFFHFSSNAYLLTEKQEIWADSMYYERPIGKGDLYGNVQLLDTTQKMLAFADEGHMLDNPERVTLMKEPSVAYYSVDSASKRDTLFLRGDIMKMITGKNPKYYSPDTLKSPGDSLAGKTPDAQSLLNVDTTAKDTPADSLQQQPFPVSEKDSLSPLDSLQQPLSPEQVHDSLSRADSLQLPPKSQADSLPTAAPLADTAMATEMKKSAADTIRKDTVPSQEAVAETKQDTIKKMAEEAIQWMLDSLWAKKTSPLDSLVPKGDSIPPSDTIVRYVYAYHHVRAYRSDVQMVCDSLAYSTLDSMARLYIRPALWHDTYQITSDSMLFYTENQKLSRAEFLSSAFLLFYEELPLEDTIYYNQVKGRDMMGYFRDNELYRFDVVGGAQTIYYLSEDSVVVNVDIAESKLFSAYVKNRKIQRMKNTSDIKRDLFPIWEKIPQERIVLKGFELRGGERPKTRYDVCDRIIKASRRDDVSQIPMPSFPITERIDALDNKKK